jgi:hypothetical protein
MEKLSILERIVPGYTERYLAGQYSLEEMPLLDAITKNYEEGLRSIDMSNIYLIACQHMLEPQLRMFQKLIALGFRAQNIFILPKVYSANESIMKSMESLGLTIFRSALDFPLDQSFDLFHQKQCRSVLAFVMQNISHAEKILLLDDGGMLIKTFYSNRAFIKQFKNKAFATEQTASGKNILLKSELSFLVDSVASSVEKIQIETGYVVRLCSERVREYFASHTIPTTAKVLIKGLGPIGQTLFEDLSSKGYDCIGYDKNQGKFKHSLNSFDVIIGATGDSIVQQKHIPELKRGCHLISVSSSDREFPAPYLRSHANTGSVIHETFWNKEYDVYLANGGFPITFKGNRVECQLLEMDVTKMKLLESILNHIVGTSEIKASVNILYPNLWLKLNMKWIYTWYVAMFLLCVLKISLLGMSKLEPSSIFWYLFVVLILSGSISALRFIKFYKRLERY